MGRDGREMEGTVGERPVINSCAGAQGNDPESHGGGFPGFVLASLGAGGFCFASLACERVQIGPVLCGSGHQRERGCGRLGQDSVDGGRGQGAEARGP